MRGFTLIELLTVLALIGVLMFIGGRGLSRLVAEVRADSDIQSIAAAVQFTRATAVTAGEPITLCPLDARGRCNGDWSSGFAVFADPERQARLPPGGKILRRFTLAADKGALQFRAFGSNRFLRMLPNGQTAWQNGRFEYCPAHPDVRPRVLIVNVQGRARILPAKLAADGQAAGANRAARC